MKQQCKHSRQKYWHTSTRTARAGAAKRAYRPSMINLRTEISNLILHGMLPQCALRELVGPARQQRLRAPVDLPLSRALRC